jgi:methylmalonyl-CoA mutase, N-terminal domain
MSESPSTSAAARDVRLTNSGIPTKAFYTPDDLPDYDYPSKLGDPAHFPFARGIFPKGYRAQPWMESLASGFGLPETTRRRELAMQRFGQSAYGGHASMNLVFDRPTFEGYDSDHPFCRHEVGEVGVVVDSWHDLARLFEGSDLSTLNVGFIVDRSGPPILAMHVALADFQGVPRSALRGIVTNNPLEAYFISRMKLFPPRAALRMTADVAQYCLAELPHFNFCRVNGYNLRESGATAIQEVAFVLAKAVAILAECINRGLEPGAVASHMSFQFSQDSYFFEEIAKIRAARRLWASILRERFGVQDDRDCRMKIHMQTGGSTLQAQDPLNNVVRIGLQTLSAALAGAQSVHIAAYDEAIGIPTEDSVRLAIKTSKIVQHEIGVADVVDPLGGSWYVESLTDELSERALAELQKVDAQGGAIGAIENRYLEREIANSAVRTQKEVEAGRRVVVGVNQFADEHATAPHSESRTLEADREVAIERCRALKAGRDRAEAEHAMASIREAARDPHGAIFPTLITAAKAQVTVGEMLGALTDVFGEWLEPSILGELE